MSSTQFFYMIASVAEDYTKRFLEYKYDSLGKTDAFRKLKDMDIRKRFAVEFALYLLNGLVKLKAKESTPFSAFVKGVACDSIPEISKRLINGDVPEGQPVKGASEQFPSEMIDALWEELSKRLKNSAE